MSTVLKLDGRTVRGRIWKDLNTCGKTLKQGILLNKVLCSFCNHKPDAETEVITCMNCNSAFHISCLLKPVSERFLNVIAENPSVFWFCPACIGCKSGDNGNNDTDIAYSSTDGDIVRSNVIMQSTLMSFKHDILKLVGETIDNKFKNFSNPACSKAVTSGNDGAQQNNNSNTVNDKKTYSKALSGTPTVQSQPFVHPPVENKSHPVQSGKKLEKHVLLLKRNDEFSTSSEYDEKQSLNSVYKAVTNVNIEFCSVKKSGTIAIGFPDAASKKIAAEKINNDVICNSVFTTDSPKKMLPKVTVKNINEVLFENCDTSNRDEMKAVLLKDIMLRNKGIQSIIDSDSNEFIHVVTIQKVMPSSSYVTYNAVLKMSCQIRNYIHQNEDKLYVSFNRCRVTDRFHVTQCYHCQKPGHFSDNCSDKKDGKPPTCFYCSGSHASKSCPTKHQEDQDTCCVNCLKSNNPDMVENAKTHTAASYKCPILQSYVKNIKSKTENWQEKNYHRSTALH